jgi:hypothetical protein
VILGEKFCLLRRRQGLVLVPVSCTDLGENAAFETLCFVAEGDTREVDVALSR